MPDHDYDEKHKDKNTEHEEKFTFNENVTQCFSDMLERSIPNYDTMRSLITTLAVKYSPQYSTVVDLGTSTGDIIANIKAEKPDLSFIGLENSESMIESARQRFKKHSNIHIRQHDLRNQFSVPPTCTIISCLTIQFTPIEYRLQILKNVYDALLTDGIFIFVEKVLGASAEIDKKMVETYYDMKLKNGYSGEEIQRKRLALEGVLVPVTSKWNKELLAMSGFTKVDCFWRCLNFEGLIAIK